MSGSEEKDRNERNYICPNCGQEVAFFVTTLRSRYAKCPRCGASIDGVKIKEKYGENALLWVSKEVYNKAGEVEYDEYIAEALEDAQYAEKPAKARKEEETSGETREATEVKEEIYPTLGKEEDFSIFDKMVPKPKHPCQVLKELLELYEVNRRITKLLLKKCEVDNGISPVDLGLMLEIFGGERGRKLARFLVPDYIKKLKKELEKARETEIDATIIYRLLSPSMSETELSSLPGGNELVRDMMYFMQYTKSELEPLLRKLSEKKPEPPPIRRDMPPHYPYRFPEPRSEQVRPPLEPPKTYPEYRGLPERREELYKPLFAPPRERIEKIEKQTDLTGIANLISSIASLFKEDRDLFKEFIVKKVFSEGESKSKASDLELLRLFMDMQREQMKSISEGIAKGMEAIGEAIKSLQANFYEALKSLAESQKKLYETIEKSRDTTPPEVLSKLAELEASLKYTEELMKLREEMHKSEKEKLKAEANELRETIKMLSEELRKAQTLTQGYQTDEAKLASVVITELKPLFQELVKRKPIETLSKTLLSLAKISTGLATPEKVEEVPEVTRTTTDEEALKLLEKEGLIEE